MHTKTMEGLVGARTNMNLLNTPMRVFKDARRRGDTATMDMSAIFPNRRRNIRQKLTREWKRTQDRQEKKQNCSRRRQF